MFFPLNRKGRYAIFASLGRNVRSAAGYSYLRNVITEIVEEGVIVMLAEAFRAVERSFEGTEKVKRAGFKLLPTRTGYGGCLH
ncbi:MAG: hypothetical protein ACLU4N_15840 [Butyricimonas faecihominis]